MEISKCSIYDNATVLDVLKMIDNLPSLQTVFVLNSSDIVVGTVTDGDIRRALISGLMIDNKVTDVMFRNFSYLKENQFYFEKISNFRKRKLKAVPLLCKKGKLLKIYDFTKTKSILPVDAFIMAGGKGERLRPLTEQIPKPLLKVGGKEIISYNFDRLSQFGINNQYVSVNYLGEKIIDFCKDYNSEIKFHIIKEKKFLGTAGALSLVDTFYNDVILLMNSDLLTDINYEDFYKFFIDNKADILVASIPYRVSIPYAIFEHKKHNITSLMEKPEHIYYANAGIYLIKKSMLSFIPKNKFFNATDLLHQAIDKKKNVLYYPMHNYWLDIGKPQDFKKANKDILNLNL
tara:strand:+ start:2460 stop:3500 length:1041 start_codon:yes stop_codon:yes gene_type:complete